MVQADTGDIALITKAHDDHVRALVRLNNFPHSYLFVGREVDPQVISHVTDTRLARSGNIIIWKRSAIAYRSRSPPSSSSLPCCSCCRRFGSALFFPRQLILPISTLIAAADRIRAGDMAARVPIRGKHDEFDVLARAFNRMDARGRKPAR